MARIGREPHAIYCRETAGLALGGGLAQKGTFAEAENPDVVVLSMGPDRRHVTKPVCEITYGLREAELDVSVVVMKSGFGPPKDYPFEAPGAAGMSGITPKEEEQVSRHKLAIIHLGNVPKHFVHKARVFLGEVDIPAIVVCQAPVGFKDFAEVGVRTRVVEPEEPETKGEIVDIVTGVVRGQTVPEDKIAEIVGKVRKWLRKSDEGRV